MQLQGAGWPDRRKDELMSEGTFRSGGSAEKEEWLVSGLGGIVYIHTINYISTKKHV